jgi:uncharacterized protein YuzE
VTKPATGGIIVADKAIALSTHAQHSAAERKIAEEWIAQVVRNPVTREPDPTRPGATRAFGPIAAFGKSYAARCVLRSGNRISGGYGILRSPRDEKEAKSMRVRMDEGADALYIRFEESPIVESEEVSPGVILDFDENGRVVGLEMLNVRQRLPGADLKRVEVEVA